MAPFSSQLCKHHCPSGNWTIAGWANVQPGRSSWEEGGLTTAVPRRVRRQGLKGWSQNTDVHPSIINHWVKTNQMKNIFDSSSLPERYRNGKSESCFGILSDQNDTCPVPSQNEMVVCQLAVNHTIAPWCSKGRFFWIKLHSAHHRDESGILKQIPDGNKVEQLNQKPWKLQEMYFQAWRLWAE